jgi:diphosphomevalonate decarboxylase
LTTLKTEWSSPSNIALVKYWGKTLVQIPTNPSVSFTLCKSKSVIQIEASPSDTNEINVDFFYAGSVQEKFKLKIVKYLMTKIDRFPWLKEYQLKIRSENTFPHSSGIASSASSMSALNLCLLSLDRKITGKESDSTDFYQEASDLSRQASGSAARSVYPFMATWGEIDDMPGTSNLFASPVNADDIHPIFHNYCDAIIIVDENEKSVSSRAGHALMDNHPFKEERYKRARANLSELMGALKAGDLEVFTRIVEEEALMLHALMMTSTPSYILLKPESLEIIEKIRKFRAEQNVPICFTIDAGPNIHLLYPSMFSPVIDVWLGEEFRRFKMIRDCVGEGPVGTFS